MFDYNKKKISLSILLITMILISFISKIKINREIPTAFDDTIFKNPTEWARVNVIELFGCDFDYNNTLFALLLFVIMSILLFIFTDDILIREKIKGFKINVLKWDIKLLTISALVFACILILGKSCKNNLKEASSIAIEDASFTPFDTVSAPPTGINN